MGTGDDILSLGRLAVGNVERKRCPCIVRYVVMMESSCDPSGAGVGSRKKTESSTPVTASGLTNWMEMLLNAVGKDGHDGSGNEVNSGAGSPPQKPHWSALAGAHGAGNGSATHQVVRRRDTRRPACVMGCCTGSAGIRSVRFSNCQL